MLNLPSEIHHMIAGQCELVDIAAVSTTCRQLHQVYNVLLYEQNVKFHNSSALRSICQYKEQRFSVAALKNAISAGANLQRTFYKVVTHTLPRQYSWSRPGFDQIAYVHYLTPLHLAASAGLCDAVTLFLDDGIDVDVAAESLGWTPLFFALNKRRDRTARRLIDQGASLILGSGLTALHMAVAANLRDISTYLINDKGMDLNSGDRNGDTPLVYALTSPYTTEESILHLLTLGADANKRVFVSGQCWSPLSISLRCGRWDFAEKLLDHGADVEGTSGLTISHPDATRAEITHPLLLALFAKPPRDRRSRKRIITRLLAKADPKMEGELFRLRLVLRRSPPCYYATEHEFQRRPSQKYYV
ncbi:ankyrin repeat-containing domain protein [Annulohypoxylon stygium]|nr:ankyrin repeat-containing domain protein [Annulohypoxylon stygium]